MHHSEVVGMNLRRDLLRFENYEARNAVVGKWGKGPRPITGSTNDETRTVGSRTHPGRINGKSCCRVDNPHRPRMRDSTRGCGEENRERAVHGDHLTVKAAATLQPGNTASTITCR